MAYWWEQYLQGRNPFGAANGNVNDQHTVGQSLMSNSSGGDNGPGSDGLNQPYSDPSGTWNGQGQRMINGSPHVQLGGFAREGNSVNLSDLVRDPSLISYDSAGGLVTPQSNFTYRPDDSLDNFMGYAVPALLTAGAANFGGAGGMWSNGLSGAPGAAAGSTAAEIPGLMSNISSAPYAGAITPTGAFAGAGTGFGSGGLMSQIGNAASGLLSGAMKNPLTALQTLSGVGSILGGIGGLGGNRGGAGGGSGGPASFSIPQDVTRPQWQPNPYTSNQLAQFMAANGMGGQPQRTGGGK